MDTGRKSVSAPIQNQKMNSESSPLQNDNTFYRDWLAPDKIITTSLDIIRVMENYISLEAAA